MRVCPVSLVGISASTLVRGLDVGRVNIMFARPLIFLLLRGQVLFVGLPGFLARF